MDVISLMVVIFIASIMLLLAFFRERALYGVLAIISWAVTAAFSVYVEVPVGASMASTFNYALPSYFTGVTIVCAIWTYWLVFKKTAETVAQGQRGGGRR